MEILKEKLPPLYYMANANYFAYDGTVMHIHIFYKDSLVWWKRQDLICVSSMLNRVCEMWKSLISYIYSSVVMKCAKAAWSSDWNTDFKVCCESSWRKKFHFVFYYCHLMDKKWKWTFSLCLTLHPYFVSVILLLSHIFSPLILFKVCVLKFLFIFNKVTASYSFWYSHSFFPSFYIFHYHIIAPFLTCVCFHADLM